MKGWIWAATSNALQSGWILKQIIAFAPDNKPRSILKD